MNCILTTKTGVCHNIVTMLRTADPKQTVVNDLVITDALCCYILEFPVMLKEEGHSFERIPHC